MWDHHRRLRSRIGGATALRTVNLGAPQAKDKLTSDFEILMSTHSTTDVVDIAPVTVQLDPCQYQEGILGVVVVDWSHMSQDLRSVQTDPVKGGVGKFVATTGQYQNLRTMATYIEFQDSFWVKKLYAPACLQIWGS